MGHLVPLCPLSKTYSSSLTSLIDIWSLRCFIESTAKGTEQFVLYANTSLKRKYYFTAPLTLSINIVTKMLISVEQYYWKHNSRTKTLILLIHSKLLNIQSITLENDIDPRTYFNLNMKANYNLTKYLKWKENPNVTRNLKII